MPEALDLTWVWAATLLFGGLLGGVFFVGLWCTLGHLSRSPTPIRWLLGSLMLRTAIVLAGFYAVAAGQPLRLGLCLLGFMLARSLLLGIAHRSTARMNRPCA